MIARLNGRASLLLSFSGPKFARFCVRSEGLVFWRCVEKGRLPINPSYERVLGWMSRSPFPPSPPLSLSMGALKVSTRFSWDPPSRVGADGRSRSGLGWCPLPLYRSRWSGFFPSEWCLDPGPSKPSNLSLGFQQLFGSLHVDR